MLERFNISNQHELTGRILDLAVQIQQIPAPTFAEGARAKFIRDQFVAIGAIEVNVDNLGNVYTRVPGISEKPPIVVSAHLDTVFPHDTELTIKHFRDKVSGPGIGDNSLGLAGLFGLFWAFSGSDNSRKKASRMGDLWLVANVGEEGLGDLKGMKSVVERFGRTPSAYIVLEGMALGQIYHQGLGVRRYRVRVKTKGGHSWVDFGSPSAIHELADLIVKIKGIPVPAKPRSSMNVGMISGGTSVNTIAAMASIELDLRSENSQALDTMIDQVERLVNEADQKKGEAVEVLAEVIGNRPAGEISADHPLVKTAVKCYANHGIKAKLNIGSTDANEPLSRGYPAICVGITSGGASHTIGEYIHTKPVGYGFEILVDLIHTLNIGS